MKRKRTSRLRRGMTLIEVLTASVLGTMAIYGAMMAMYFGSSSWYRGAGKVDAENRAQAAIRYVSSQLRQAMSVSVASDGNSLTYRMPVYDNNGDIAIPVTWDNVSRSIYLDNGELKTNQGGSIRSVCWGVISTDPYSSGGNQTYRIFTAGAGAITRQVTVEVATSRKGYQAETVKSRRRETIYLRNIPQLSR